MHPRSYTANGLLSRRIGTQPAGEEANRAHACGSGAHEWTLHGTTDTCVETIAVPGEPCSSQAKAY